jgi:hypothetical protein
MLAEPREQPWVDPRRGRPAHRLAALVAPVGPREAERPALHELWTVERQEQVHPLVRWAI